MSLVDQCPSTKGKKPLDSGRTPHDLLGATGSGRHYWRSLDDLADTPGFREWIDREFPAGASELLESSRRNFLKVMGASLALAGAATIPGCRRPDHKIMPYSKDVPEDIVPGKALFYATSMPLPGGGAEGLLVETHEGRPTKIEGNPLHSINQGRSSAWAQASVLGLYDPDRLKDPVLADFGSGPHSWADFDAWLDKNRAELFGARGERVAFIVDKKTSPTRDALRDRIAAALPDAAWCAYDPIESPEATRASREAFGRPMRELLHLSSAKVILSFDRDFLSHADPRHLLHSRAFAATRRVARAADPMSRLYVVESGFSAAGAKADHRLRMAPSVIPALAVAVAKSLVKRTGFRASPALVAAINAVPVPQGVSLNAAWVDAVADDLMDTHGNLGHSLILAGPSQPAAVHALVHALNAAMGSVGTTVSYIPMSAEQATPSAASLAAVCDAINAGRVRTVVCIGVNPVYDAPADLNFAQVFAKAHDRITLSVDLNETVAASNVRLPAAHFLESWGDSESADGSISPVQPMIAPLYAGRSELELLAQLAGETERDPYEIVRSAWRARFGAANFDKKWRRALFDGVMTGPVEPAAAPIDEPRIAAMLAGLSLSSGPSRDALDVVFTVGYPGDGRYANQAWLQELPDPASKIAWDNAALLSPDTAAALGLTPEPETKKKRRARMARIELGGHSINVPAWIVPGLPENTALVHLGYGRETVGVVGEGVGFNAYKLRASSSFSAASGAKITPAVGADEWYTISVTQQHGSMHGRALVREFDLPAWQKHGEHTLEQNDPYGREHNLNFAERAGELGHMPATVNIYKHPYTETIDPTPAPGSEYATGPQWGMTIDLTTCSGCNVCTIACQAENNIPVVGKIETDKGREMHWIRVDRYFVSNGDALNKDPFNDPDLSIAFQPVACVHCENAPCETVCPVNATVHGPEGINYMVYNRCIGTRYCANNCPYKVRRFNFFDFGVAKFNGGFGLQNDKGEYTGRDMLPGGGPKNVNLIPPRLRQKIDEISKMQYNPNVTVRSRGVMEKCSYCIQRINNARIEVKLQNLPNIPDGFFKTACQQACPSDSITFGDILDKNSNVSRLRSGGRSYLLLGFLNTRPRTSYLAAIRNPNPKLRKPVEDPFHHGHSDHDHDHGDHDHQHGSLNHDSPTHAFLHTRAADDPGYKLTLGVLGALA